MQHIIRTCSHNCKVSSKYFKRFSSYGADTKLHLIHQAEDNSESMKTRDVILVRDILSWPVLHNCAVSWLYLKRFSSYGADTKLHLKPSRGNNSESTKARVVDFVCDTLSWPVLRNCEVSWLYTKRYSSYRADTNMHKNIKWQITQKVLKRGLSLLYATHRYDLSTT